MTPTALRTAVSGLALSLASAGALAQWGTDPASNFRLADAPGDQVQPKIAPTADGGAYISWFDNRTGGYDVYLQRVNAAGIEQWQHNGILIADRAVSSTQDYSLVVDAAGDAVIAYNDDGGVSGAAQQVSLQRVDPSGNLLWGAHGVTVTSGTAFKGPPFVAALTDGTYVVGYLDGSLSPSGWRVYKVDQNGALVWASPLSVNETGHPLSVSDVKPGENGTFIVLWVRQFSTSGSSSKYLLAQKYDGSTQQPIWPPSDTTGNALGPVTGVIVYMPAPGSTYIYNGGSGTYNATQGGSIQTGYFPTMIADGQGGVVIGWYENAGPRNAYVQHILASGALQFPMNGVSNTFTSNARIRLDAGVAYDAVNGVYYLASTDSSNPTQGNYGEIVQKFDGAGTRLWGDSGVILQAPGSGGQPSFSQSVAFGDGCIASWLDTTAATTRVVKGARVNGDQSVAWNGLVNSDGATDKSRLTMKLSTGGFAMLAYGWGSVANGSDIGIARLNGDGSQGVPACYANCDSSTTAPVLNVSDFTCFLQKYAAGDAYANCDSSTTPPVLNVSDFTCFLQKYAAGCP